MVRPQLRECPEFDPEVLEWKGVLLDSNYKSVGCFAGLTFPNVVSVLVVERHLHRVQNPCLVTLPIRSNLESLGPWRRLGFLLENLLVVELVQLFVCQLVVGLDVHF